MSVPDIKDLRERFRTDGVIHLPGVLDPEFVELMAIGIQRNLAAPSPNAHTLYPGTDREMLMDHSNFRLTPEYQILLADSPIAGIVADVLESESIWLFFDQIWVKEPGAVRRTPWHQDATSWLVGGNQVAGFWMSVDPLEAHESLEWIPGTHQGPVYAGASFDPYDETKPYYGDSTLPRIPDIEADRAKWNIVSFPHDPTDAVMFHPAVLHGGGAGAGRRRTLSLRFYGDDGIYSPRPGKASPACPGVAATHQPGDPLRSGWYPRVFPQPSPGWW